MTSKTYLSLKVPTLRGKISLRGGTHKFGYTFRKDNSSEYNYYCPDKQVWEQLGYFKDEAGDENG